jgi:adenosylhomocysteine nucleosidase
MILVLIPSHFEAQDFQASLEDRREYRIGAADCTDGRIGNVALTLAVIGMGPPQAALRAQAVIAARAARIEKNASTELGVILCGFAGGLKPGLKRGEIFLTAGAEHLLPLLPETERPPVASLVTVDAIAATPPEKAALFARSGTWLVDMEQAQVAAVVAAAGLPFVGIRIVSDEAQEELPVEIMSQAYDQQTGTYTTWKLVGYLARHPFRVRPLVSFVRSLPPIRSRMTERLRTWLTLAGPRLFPRP